MTIKTWEMLQEEAVQKLGNDLGPLFINLRAQLHDIEWKWNEYLVLFGTKESRIDILNSAAPKFFGSLQDILFSDAILHIARITDPSKSAGKSNLTVRALVENLTNTAIKNEIFPLVNLVISTTEFCREWRNKRIAHADLLHFTDEHPAPLEEATREKVAIAIDAIREVLSKISQEYLDSKVHPVSEVVIGGALDLLYKLDDAIHFEKERKERLESGQFLPNDIRSRNI